MLRVRGTPDLCIHMPSDVIHSFIPQLKDCEYSPKKINEHIHLNEGLSDDLALWLGATVSRKHPEGTEYRRALPEVGACHKGEEVRKWRSGILGTMSLNSQFCLVPLLMKPYSTQYKHVFTTLTIFHLVFFLKFFGRKYP